VNALLKELPLDSDGVRVGLGPLAAKTAAPSKSAARKAARPAKPARKARSVRKSGTKAAARR
jgi:hypothetical protein